MNDVDGKWRRINADRGTICEDIIHTGKYGECDSTAVDDRT